MQIKTKAEVNTACYKLTIREWFRVLFTRKIWIKAVAFDCPSDT